MEFWNKSFEIPPKVGAPPICHPSILADVICEQPIIEGGISCSESFCTSKSAIWKVFVFFVSEYLQDLHLLWWQQQNPSLPNKKTKVIWEQRNPGNVIQEGSTTSLQVKDDLKTCESSPSEAPHSRDDDYRQFSSSISAWDIDALLWKSVYTPDYCR